MLRENPTLTQTREGRELFRAAKQIITGTVHEQELFPKPKKVDDRKNDKWMNDKLNQMMKSYKGEEI